MRAWAGRIGLLMVFGMMVALVAVVPSAVGVAEPARPYRQTIPLIASDSASGSTTPVPGNSDSNAARLVSDLTAATTNPDRGTALIHMFDALHIGVYNGDGTAIVSGAEKSSQDYYLYKPEIEMTAASLAAGDRWSFDDLAAFLNASAALNTQVTAQQLQTAAANTIRDAQAHTSDAAWISPLIVQELGLKHAPADDLTVSTATSAKTLDALQRTLILTDLLIGLPRSNAQVAASSNLAADSGGILQQSPVTAQGACGDFHGTEAVRNIGKFAAGFIDVAGKAIQIITAPLDLSHAISLALGVKVEALADNLKTHYGHEDPGKELKFPVRVRMLDEVTQTQIECGWMAGITYPKQGPIPNIKIEWDYDTLQQHGTITCGLDCQQTGDDGIATLVFQPKQEQAPYTGPLTSETGRVEANALYLSSLGNMYGPVSEAATPKLVDFVWNVEWHAKGTWEGTITNTWTSDGEQFAQGTANVKFELALASPGEGDSHTNVYKLTQGTMQWNQSLDDCRPSPKTGTDSLDAGSADLTVTENNGQMTYEFVEHSNKTVPYTVLCGDDNTSVPVIAIPVGFPFPMEGDGITSYQGPSQPIGTTITGSTTIVTDDGSVTWTWKLTKK